MYYRCHFKSWVKWIPATIKKQVSPLTYLIEINGTVRYVQENQIRYPSAQDKHNKTFSNNPIDLHETADENESLVLDLSNVNNSPEVVVVSDLDSSYHTSVSQSNSNVTSPSSSSHSNTPIISGQKRKRSQSAFQLRRSKRNKKKLKRFGNNVYDRSFT